MSECNIKTCFSPQLNYSLNTGLIGIHIKDNLILFIYHHIFLIRCSAKKIWIHIMCAISHWRAEKVPSLLCQIGHNKADLHYLLTLESGLAFNATADDCGQELVCIYFNVQHLVDIHCTNLWCVGIIVHFMQKHSCFCMLAMLRGSLVLLRLVPAGCHQCVPCSRCAYLFAWKNTFIVRQSMDATL